MNTRVNCLQNIWRLTLVLFLLIGLLDLQPVQSAWAAEDEYLWAKAMSGTGNEYGAAIAVDDSGNIYVTGAFEGTVDFDPGAGITELTSAGFEDIFVTKLDHNGYLLWAKAMGGTGYDASTAIAIDASGNLFVTGYFEGTVDFDPGTSSTVMTSVGNDDVFILKLDSNGELAWVKTVGGVLDDSSNGIAVDGYGNAYITGYFRATVDFDPGAGTVELTSAGSDDIFISKLDSSGGYLWATAIGGTGVDASTAIAVDAFGKTYITGSFEATIDFDPGAGTAALTSAGASDIFVSKFDTNGGYEWATRVSGTSDSDWGSAIVVDESSNIYVAGILFSADNFISKLDNYGNELWSVAVMGTGVWGGIDGVTVSVDNAGNVYTCGYFFGTVDFDPGTGSYDLTGTGSNYDIFVEKFNNDGNFLWVESIGDVGFDVCTDIAMDDYGNLFTTGSFEGTVDFDPGAGSSELTSAGEVDIFISKLKGDDIALNVPLDVVLVIDASDSMTYDAEPGDPMRDPSQCNPAHNCHPFEDVKTAAAAFVEKLNFPNDRLAVVTFDDGARVDLGFSTNKIEIQNAIDSLGVIEPDICPTASGPCREYKRYSDDDPVYGNQNGNPYDEPFIDANGDGIADTYLGFDCAVFQFTGNPSTCSIIPKTWGRRKKEERVNFEPCWKTLN